MFAPVGGGAPVSRSASVSGGGRAAAPSGNGPGIAAGADGGTGLSPEAIDPVTGMRVPSSYEYALTLPQAFSSRSR